MDNIKQFSETAKGLAKNPLGIIALFIVLIYGFASLVLGLSSNLQGAERMPIVWFLVIFPVIVLGVFAWLVSRHHEKLYAPKDYTDDKSFLDAASAKHNLREEILNIDHEIEKKIHASVTSPEFIERLKQSNGQIEDVLNDIATKASQQVFESSFLEIDAREFTGDKEFAFTFPVSAFSTLSDLTDQVYFTLANYINPFEYGFTWVLKDSTSDQIIKNARMITNASKGFRVPDNRSLKEVNIHGGTKLIVEKPTNT